MDNIKLEIAPTKLSEWEIKYNVLYYFSRMLTQWVNYTKRWNLFKDWKTIWKNEWWDVQTHINFFYRFCKTFASYVVKDSPNINVPAEHPDQPESKMLASKKEKVLNNWRAWNSFVRKLKVAALRNAAFWDMYFFISYDKKNKWFSLDFIDPTNVIYDTVDSSPYSEKMFVLWCRLEDISILKKKYPEFADRIVPSSLWSELIKVDKFKQTALWSQHKAIVFYYMDKNYIYTVINADMVVETVEHKYWFIPFYHRPCIDRWEFYWESLIEKIYEPVKYMHLALSYIITNAYDTATSPLVAIWWTPQLADQKGRVRWLLTLPAWPWTSVTYLDPPRANMDLYKIVEVAKQFMHFVSWISEEAMAWYTWALTSAWVAIELRLDSTVREALDSQVVLQDILQRINADWLRLMQKFMSNDNLLKNPLFWEIEPILKFTWDMIWNNYSNIVDFGWILPRAETQVVSNVIAKLTQWLISKDTALEELRYADPSMEISKILKEQRDMYKFQDALKKWEESQFVWYNWPKEENYAMLIEKKFVPVLPDQNHMEHWVEHQSAYQKNNDQWLLLHMMAHESLYKQWGWVWIDSPETEANMVRQAYDKRNSSPEWNNMPQQAMTPWASSNPSTSPVFIPRQ